LVRASRGMSWGSRPTQSTREGPHEPFHPGTVFLSSSTRALDVGVSSSTRGAADSVDELYGLFLVRSMRKGWPRKVIGTRSWTRKMFSTLSLLEYMKYAYLEPGPNEISRGVGDEREWRGEKKKKTHTHHEVLVRSKRCKYLRQLLLRCTRREVRHKDHTLLRIIIVVLLVPHIKRPA